MSVRSLAVAVALSSLSSRALQLIYLVLYCQITFSTAAAFPSTFLKPFLNAVFPSALLMTANFKGVVAETLDVLKELTFPLHVRYFSTPRPSYNS